MIESAPQIIDLTHPIHEGMTTFPVAWHPYVEVTQLARHGIEERETRKLILGTHTGTHLDAPRHFVPGGPTVDQIPLSTLVGPAQVIDLTDLPDGTAIGPDLLAPRIEPGPERCERLLFRFDWCRHWGSKKFYEDHPYVTSEAALWLAAAGARLIGMDTPQLDCSRHGRGSGNDSPIHKLLLGGGCVFVECLCNLARLRGRYCRFVAAPLNVLQADGAPARCFAWET